MASAEHDMELTEAEQASYEGQKARLFKATIAVNVVYGVFALSILIAIIANEAARALLTGPFAPFTITFLLGMLLIILWLIVEVYEFKPVKRTTIDRDPLSCPDYYTLERTPSDVLDRAPAKYKSQMAFRCVPRKDVFPVTQFSSNVTFTGYSVSNVVLDLNNNFTNNDDKIKCNNIYPAFLHAKDVTTNKNDPTKYRCEFIGKNGCNTLSWTSVCPHPKP